MLKIITLLTTIITLLPTANAVDIQQLTTPSGIEVWLVESHALPMVSVEVAFRAGSTFDPKTKEGLASFTANLLTEGAGNMNATALQQQIDRLGMRIGANVDMLNTSINMKTISKNTNKAFALMGEIITTPRFDNDAALRIQQVMLAMLKRSQENPSSVASKEFFQTLFTTHPYAHPTSGYEKSVATFSTSDAKDFYKTNYTRSNMVVSVVGDITPKQLIPLVDNMLAKLPQGEGRNNITALPTPPTPQIKRIEMPIPQGHVILGHLGISRNHPDCFAIFFMNYILGGGGFSSRLTEEVREKKGLAYSIGSRFIPLPQKGIFIVSVQTKNKYINTSIDIIRTEIKKIALGVTKKEYDDGLNYLIGSFPMRIDSNTKILSYLTTMQMEGLGPYYLSEWVGKIKSVSREDIKRVAKHLLKPSELVTIIVGGKNE